MRYALWFRVETELVGTASLALRRWLSANGIPIPALSDGPIIVNTDLRTLEAPPGVCGPHGLSVTLHADIPEDLWAVLVAADALWCARLEHIAGDQDCGAPLDDAAQHRPTTAGGPIDGAGDQAGEWELAVPFVVTTAHGGAYDTETFEAGYWLGRVDLALEQAKTIGAACLVFPMVPAGILPQLELQGMYRGYPIVTHDMIPSGAGPDHWCTVTFTRGAQLA